MFTSSSISLKAPLTVFTRDWLFSHGSKSVQFEWSFEWQYFTSRCVIWNYAQFKYGPDHHLNCAIQSTNHDVHFVILRTHGPKYCHSNDHSYQYAQLEWLFKLRTFALVLKQSFTLYFWLSVKGERVTVGDLYHFTVPFSFKNFSS